VGELVDVAVGVGYAFCSPKISTIIGESTACCGRCEKVVLGLLGDSGPVLDIPAFYLGGVKKSVVMVLDAGAAFDVLGEADGGVFGAGECVSLKVPFVYVEVGAVTGDVVHADETKVVYDLGELPSCDVDVIEAGGDPVSCVELVLVYFYVVEEVPVIFKLLYRCAIHGE